MMTWLAPVLIGVTALLLGRAHYVLYVLGRGNAFSMAMTWISTIFVIGFWSWQWIVSKCL